jgi:hypothetical protein
VGSARCLRRIAWPSRLESGIHGEFRSSADSIRISDAAAGAVAATDRANGLSYEPGPTEGDMSRIAGLPDGLRSTVSMGGKPCMTHRIPVELLLKSSARAFRSRRCSSLAPGLTAEDLRATQACMERP